MSDNQMPAAGRVKVKRDGPRGWHWIAAASFDPTKHELADSPAAAPAGEKPLADIKPAAVKTPRAAKSKPSPGAPNVHR